MKKIVFILVLLLFTAPALATVTIDANQVVPGSNEVVITYFSDGNLPRAFGLDITVTDGNIVACTPAMEGECTDSDRGFGIFPSTIVIDDAPPQAEIIDAGNPVSTVPPALGGLDTNGVTIELGSLYQEPNAPPLSGVLCTIVVTKSCIVRIAGNAARCGESSPALGVVMEDKEEIPIVIFGTADVNIDDGPGPCIPSDHPDYDDWVLLGEPNSWCHPRQCHGDADGIENVFGPPHLPVYAWVSTEDVAVLIEGFRHEPAYSNDPVADPWIAADFDHQLNQFGPPHLPVYRRVSTEDVAILVYHFRDAHGVPPDDCQTTSPSSP